MTDSEIAYSPSWRSGGDEYRIEFHLEYFTGAGLKIYSGVVQRCKNGNWIQLGSGDVINGSTDTA